MKDEVPLLPIRERIKDLNTKAYYLLVALSFIYRSNSGALSLKIGFNSDGSCCRFPCAGLPQLQTPIRNRAARQGDFLGSLSVFCALVDLDGSSTYACKLRQQVTCQTRENCSHPRHTCSSVGGCARSHRPYEHRNFMLPDTFCNTHVCGFPFTR